MIQRETRLHGRCAVPTCTCTLDIAIGPYGASKLQTVGSCMYIINTKAVQVIKSHPGLHVSAGSHVEQI